MPSRQAFRVLLATVTASGIAVTLGLLLLTTLVFTIQKREPRPVWPKLRKFQNVVSNLTLGLSIFHCILLAQYAPTSRASDPVLVSALFELLTWLLLSMILFERNHDADLPHYYAWIAASAFQAAELVLMIKAQPPKPANIEAVDLSVFVVRLISTLALLGGALVLLRPKYHVVATEDETQPLLDPEADSTKPSDSATKSTDGSDDDDEEKDEDDDDDDDDDEADAAARKDLKKRPLGQYIASFKIFLPHLLPSTIQQTIYISVIFICIFINRIINVLVPLSIGALINSLPSAIERQEFPWKPLVLYLAMNTLVSAGIVSTVKQLATVRFEAEVKRSLNLFCYGHLMSLSCDYHDAKSSSRANRVMERGTSIAHLFNAVFFDLVPKFADLFISLGVITWLFGGYLSFVVATTIILFTYANTKFIKQKTKLRRKWIKTLISQWQHMWETLYYWATISHFNRVDYEKSQAKDKTTEMFKQEITSNDFDAMAQFIRQVILCIGYIAAAYMAIRQIIFGVRGIGDFVMLQTYWGQVMGPIAGLIRMMNSAAEEFVDAERVMLLLEKQPTIQDKTEAKDLDFQGGAVEFENVSFSYDGERVVSEDISFRIDAGQTVAIVGETGGGKSTLLKLLFRFYDPTKGRILVDGQDLRDFKIESFRDLVGFVPQDPAMFRRSVADNVRYPDLKATDEEVEAACKGAVLHDKIMTFTKGYKQKVGERGTKLSGGEAQRLAVARVILKKPKMLLLDEATSSVDSVTETKIHECLKELCKGRTTFIIAHRLSTILHADLILVMKNGKLVESGPHRKLIKKNGAYRELWSAQLKLQAENPEGTEVKTPVEGSPVLTKDGTNLLTIDVDNILVPLSDEGESSGSSTPLPAALEQQESKDNETSRAASNAQDSLIDVSEPETNEEGKANSFKPPKREDNNKTDA